MERKGEKVRSRPLLKQSLSFGRLQVSESTIEEIAAYLTEKYSHFKFYKILKVFYAGTNLKQFSKNLQIFFTNSTKFYLCHEETLFSVLFNHDFSCTCRMTPLINECVLHKCITVFQ